MDKSERKPAYYHLPGLFEFYDLYSLFLPLYKEHREYFYDWCEIGSVYGAPRDLIWGGGRTETECDDVSKVLKLLNEYGISPRLTFSNLFLDESHLSDRKCNSVCSYFWQNSKEPAGIVISSDLLLDYLSAKYPGFYYVSSTTKVITDFEGLLGELSRDEFKYVVPDFRLNKSFERLDTLSQTAKEKVEFLCNECCYFGCMDRKACYENVSLRMLGKDVDEFKCTAKNSGEGYRFSSAMKNPGFIGIDDIVNTYLPKGFNNFKIEGRGLGSAVVLEFLLYYMTKPEYQLAVREHIYLDGMLDLF